MNLSAILPLVNNVALLLALGLLYQAVPLHADLGTPRRRFGVGVAAGLIGVAVMLNPWTLSPGIVFDSRSILLAVTGLFFGPLPAVVAVGITLGVRLALGGAGVLMGVGTIVTTAGVGLLWRRLSLAPDRGFGWGELVAFGFTTHVAMLLWVVALPAPVRSPVLAAVALPALTLFPLGTALLARLMDQQRVRRAERRRHEAALSESEARFRRLAENAQDLIFRLRLVPEKRFEYVSPSATRITGYTPEQHYADPELGAKLVHPDDRPQLEAVARGEQPADAPIVLRWRRKDGVVVWTEQRNTPVFDDTGRLVAVEGVARDITETKRAEEERRRVQLQLEQSQKLEAVGRLAGGVAHDFNNMLGVILSITDILLEDLAPENPIYEDLRDIDRAAQRSADLTRQLLAFSRRQTAAPQVIDLRAFVDERRRMLGRMIGEDIELAVDVPTNGAGAPCVRIDPAQVDQILANLVVNARDAIAGAGAITIGIGHETWREDDGRAPAGHAPGDYVVLSVRDTGCGMDAQTQGRIFEPFFTTKAQGIGTGLGLATVHGIVEQNGGAVQVESGPGRGSVFRIYLPRHRSESRAVATASAALRPPLGGSETILLVEDEESLLRIATRPLERAGYVVLAAGSPAEALALLRSHEGPLELLLTDVIMPGMNGRQLQEHVCSLRPAVRTLFMSGYTGDVIAREGVIDEGTEFLAKPFRPSELLAKVRAVLDARWCPRGPGGGWRAGVGGD